MQHPLRKLDLEMLLQREHQRDARVRAEACLEEIAYQNNWIDREQLLVRAKAFGKTGYGQYLFTLAGEGL